MTTEAGPLTVAGLTIEPGRAAAGWLPVEGLPDQRLPLMVSNGAGPGPRLGVTAGMHAAEYCGIEAATRLTRMIDPTELAGSIVVVPIVNFAGFCRRTEYVSPLDGHDLHAAFPGRDDGLPSERVAATIVRHVIAPAAAYLDLHGGDLTEALAPFTIYDRAADPAIAAASRALGEVYDFGFIASSTMDGAPYAHASRTGKPAIIAEAGQQGIYDEAVVQGHLAGLQNVLRRLGMLPGEPVKRRETEDAGELLWIRSEAEGTFHPRVRVGERVNSGHLLAETRDFFGRPTGEIRAPADALVLWMMTALAMPKGVTLVGMGVPGFNPRTRTQPTGVQQL
ncbi:MAG TPA: succinylglutamate desuccinylase/aspartoacylase family protein [Bacillota bacterium]|jgi:hypothetical protein